MTISNFFLGPFLVYLPIVFWLSLFLVAGLVYMNGRITFPRFLKSSLSFFSGKKFWILVYGAIAFRILYAIFISVGQYYVWKNGGDFTSVLANSPISEKVPPTFLTDLFPSIFQSSFGYVTFYTLGRYGLNVLWSIGVAFIFWAFLRMLKRYNERFFDVRETELGLLCALIVGWPNLVVFIPLVFVSVICVSIVRGILLKEAYTTLGYPFLLATAVCLIFGSQLIDMLNLSVLRI